jgi:single-strand DNA-binding protein
MTDMNRVVLMGRLGQDPDVRYFGDNTLLKLRLATSERWVDKDQQRQERTDWHDVALWGARAEWMSKALKKGMPVVVEGSIRTSSYEREGVKRYRTEIVARNVHFFGGSTRMKDDPRTDTDDIPVDEGPFLRATPPPLPVATDDIPF